MIYKKSVVLKSINGGNEKAVLNLEYNSGEFCGKVKMYNFTREPDGILSLGILNEGKVIKAGLVKEDDSEYSFKVASGQEFNNFTCALVNLNGGKATPLLMGTTAGVSGAEQSLINSLSILDGEATVNAVQETLDSNGVYLDEQEEIDNLIDEHLSCSLKCADCKYRDAFYKLSDDPAYEEKKEETFFDEIKEQIDELFKKYQPEQILTDLIPNSKWIKVDYEDKGEYYVVGLLYENDEVKYVCYGIPSIFKEEPPKELNGFCQWLPIDTQKENGFGYWITYQDANTGENVKMDYETV